MIKKILKYIEMPFVKKSIQDFIIKYTPIALYFVMVGAVVCALCFKDYLFIYEHIVEFGNVSLLVSIYILSVTYRSKLCTYNKISSWSFLGFNILNKICEISLTTSDFNLYVTIYVPVLMIPTTLAVMYYLNRNYDSQ
jgi:hypothetical protein